MDENENKKKTKKKLIIDDIEKPKRKRGRPPKVRIPEIDFFKIDNNNICDFNEEMTEQKNENCEDANHKILDE